MYKRQLVILWGIVFFAAGCSDNNQPYTILPGPIDPSLYVLPDDVSGTWYSRTQKNAVNCGMGETIDGQVMVISQDHEAISMLMSTGDAFVGSVDGDIIEWAGAYSERGGTSNFTSATMVFSADSGSGNAAWTWSNGTDSCNGTMAIDVARDLAVQESGSNSRFDIADPFAFTDGVAYFKGTLGQPDVYDYFAFVADADGTVQAELSHFDTVSGDLDLIMYDGTQTQIAISSNPDTFEVLEAPVQAGSTYYIEVLTQTPAQLLDYNLTVDIN